MSLCASLFLLEGDGVLDGSTAAGSWLSVTDLQPYTNYRFWIRACNTQGCVESLPLDVTTSPAGKNNPRKISNIWCTADATRHCSQVSWSMVLPDHKELIEILKVNVWMLIHYVPKCYCNVYDLSCELGLKQHCKHCDFWSIALEMVDRNIIKKKVPNFCKKVLYLYDVSFAFDQKSY